MRGKRATAPSSKPRNGETKNEKRIRKNLSASSKTQNPSPPPDIFSQESPDGDSSNYPRRKQARRRGQAPKPYQDKLLNMAEARREIATALKLHRESMKQGRRCRRDPGPETELLGLESHHFSSSADQQEAAGLKSRRSPRIYASSCYVSNYTNYAYPPPPPPPGLYYSRPFCSFAPPPLYFPPENHLRNLVLPSQTLGLNLNLQGFNNLDTSSFLLCSSANNNNNNNNSSSISSSPSASCSPPPMSGEITYMAGDPASVGDDLEIGVSDGPRAEFLGPDQEDFGVSLVEFPAWVNNIADESCVTHHHHHHLCDAFFQDPALPCMDIEEIEGMDDWLA